MKYIKTFENINELQIGDYVICHELGYINDDEIDNFIQNNIGQYTVYDDIIDCPPYVIQYENIPIRLNDYFNSDNERRMHRDEIIFYSSNKKTVEDFIKIKNDLKKFNL